MHRRYAVAALVLLLGASCSKDPKPAPSKAAASASAAAPPTWSPTVTPIPPVPKGLPPLVVPESNPMTPEKAALGRQLFFDARLSTDGKASCASCHLPAHGSGGGPRPEKVTLDRHAPALWNVGYLRALFWDGRAATLEEAVAEQLTEVAGDMKGAAERARKIPGYAEQLDRVFPAETPQPQRLVLALSTFLRTLNCGDTAYDRFAAGDEAALTLQHQKGWELFEGKAKCVTCHVPPFLSDAYGKEPRFHNTGVATVDRSEDHMDQGRAKVTEQDADRGAFRTPSLRNVTKTAPYFHDGSAATVDGAVIFDAGGGVKNPRRSADLVDRKLEPFELQALIDFMSALECRVSLDEPPLPPAAK